MFNKPKVVLHTKLQKIEEVCEGMFVRSFNIETEQDEFREILKTFEPIVKNENQYELFMEDGGTIVTSNIHPMLVYREKWIYIPTENVVIGDIVKDNNGTNKVIDIHIGCSYDENFADIEVDGNNNYYATSNNSKNMYVVHNSATCNYPGWHLEFERLIELKNNKGTEETRIRTMDYAVAINGFMLKRLAEGGDITLFSPEEVPDLYEAFYSPDTEKFEELYIKYENSNKVVKKSIPATEYFAKLMNERFETGRIYIFFADTINTQTPFYESIYLTNLCVEILLASIQMGYDNSLLPLCTLAAVNWGKFSKILSEKEEKILQDCCDIIVRALDSLLDYQEYPVEAAERATKLYRPLGVGVIGLAHWMAKSKLRWSSDDVCEYVEQMMEKQTYYLTSSSINLAKEFGSIAARTKYHDGIFPKDLTKNPLKKEHMDWDKLAELAKQYGIRNATLSACMPSETSAQLSNETNGIEPPRDLISIKGSKDGALPQVVPEYNKLNHLYETLWMVDSRHYFDVVASLQKVMDQSISANSSYDPSRKEITLSVLIGDLFFAYKKGIKTLYYNQVNDNANTEHESGCSDGACVL